MKPYVFSIVFLASFFMNSQEKPKLMPERIVVDEYHGQKVEDPYRYMEDLKNEEVLNWMKANNKYAEDVMSSVPGKEGLKNLMISMAMRLVTKCYKLWQKSFGIKREKMTLSGD